ncbi:MAG: hypothetical protein J6C81_07920, partial [Muribaculaceae bacterium]|nr:hypothetical protein [Muribaculaceae bacterium]
MNIKFYITGTPPILGDTDKDADDGLPDKGELYKTPPFFDMTFTIENVENGVYNLEYIIDGSVMDASNTEIRNIHEVTSIALNSETLNIKANNGISPDNIVREGIEWVLYQPEPDNRVKFYRMQFKGKADVFFAGDGETVKDASRLFLYTGATLDEERDPVIAYFKPSGPLNARRIAADVDIP